jgi:hypothetical protein
VGQWRRNGRRSGDRPEPKWCAVAGSRGFGRDFFCTHLYSKASTQTQIRCPVTLCITEITSNELSKASQKNEASFHTIHKWIWSTHDANNEELSHRQRLSLARRPMTTSSPSSSLTPRPPWACSLSSMCYSLTSHPDLP